MAPTDQTNIDTALDDIRELIMSRCNETSETLTTLFDQLTAMLAAKDSRHERDVTNGLIDIRDVIDKRTSQMERRIIEALNALSKEQDALRAQVIGRFTGPGPEGEPLASHNLANVLLILKATANRTLAATDDHKKALQDHSDAVRDLTAQHVATRYCLAHMVLAIEANNERLESIENLLVASDQSPAAGEPAEPTGA